MFPQRLFWYRQTLQKSFKTVATRQFKNHIKWILYRLSNRRPKFIHRIYSSKIRQKNCRCGCFQMKSILELLKGCESYVWHNNCTFWNETTMMHAPWNFWCLDIRISLMCSTHFTLLTVHWKYGLIECRKIGKNNKNSVHFCRSWVRHWKRVSIHFNWSQS